MGSLHTNLGHVSTADFGRLVSVHIFLSLYMSETMPHVLLVGATGVIAVLQGSYQFLHIQQYLFIFALKVCISKNLL